MNGEYDDPVELWMEARRVIVSRLSGDGSMPEKTSVERKATGDPRPGTTSPEPSEPASPP